MLGFPPKPLVIGTHFPVLLSRTIPLGQSRIGGCIMLPKFGTKPLDLNSLGIIVCVSSDCPSSLAPYTSSLIALCTALAGLGIDTWNVMASSRLSWWSTYSPNLSLNAFACLRGTSIVVSLLRRPSWKFGTKPSNLYCPSAPSQKDSGIVFKAASTVSLPCSRSNTGRILFSKYCNEENSSFFIPLEMSPSCFFPFALLGLSIAKKSFIISLWMFVRVSSIRASKFGTRPFAKVTPPSPSSSV